jgi:hypothetical protein
MIDDTNVVGLTRERGKLVALRVVVVVGHCIGEAANDGLGDIYRAKKSVHHSERSIALYSPLFLGWVDLE